MPVTSIWPIKGSYTQALIYITNPVKTASNVNVITELEDVLDYVSNGEKTNQKYYVSGINCDPDEADLSFQKTKTAFGKPGGVPSKTAPLKRRENFIGNPLLNFPFNYRLCHTMLLFRLQVSCIGSP